MLELRLLSFQSGLVLKGEAAVVEIISIPIDKIHVPEDRIRPVDEAGAQALARLIEREGQLNPIAVYRSRVKGEGKQYTLIYGGRRLRAMDILGSKEIKAVLRLKAEAPMLEISDNLSVANLPQLEKGEHIVRYVEWWMECNSSTAWGGDRRLRFHSETTHGKSEFLKKSGFYNDLSENFNISKTVGWRLYQIGSLERSLRDALRRTRYADDQGRLLKLRKMSLPQQAGIAAALKIEPDLDTVLRIADPASGRQSVGRMETGDWREKQFTDAWEGMPRARRAAALDKIGAIMKPIDPWPMSFPPPPPIPVPGNASPLWRMMKNPYATLSAKLTYDQLEEMKADIERVAEEEDYRSRSLSAKINAEEAANREIFEKQRAKAKVAKSRKPKRGRPPDTLAMKLLKKLTKQGVGAGLAERLVYTLEVRNDFWIAKEAHKLNENQQEEVVHLIDSGCDLDDAAYRVMKMLQKPEEAGCYSAIETLRDFEQRSISKPF
ncbi:hypothetical protein GOZ81_20050 [Agrobacterium vitis]|uniref:ParB/RepB/Spo0J family partition protein n=1 Tax=Agrobacterium vitis TaxID=373 RepID=UPI0012E746FE|nr:ParB N-terminal domain-containing protein [Agrobacterium vitis]MVA73350.1 hypothetical protein [Agrobacterium vitis]